jgi:hypothetical protein
MFVVPIQSKHLLPKSFFLIFMLLSFIIQVIWNEYTTTNYQQQKLAQTALCYRQQSPLSWI